jgi:hypothetical protein
VKLQDVEDAVPAVVARSAAEKEPEAVVNAAVLRPNHGFLSSPGLRPFTTTTR